MGWNIIDKYRKEAHYLHEMETQRHVTWRHAILESIFRPVNHVKGKEPTSHLHPDLDKLHLPPHVLIADWRKYRVEDHPGLVAFQKRCHASGLHDPWLRNFCFLMYPNMRSSKSRMAVITTQLSWGFAAACVIFCAEKIYTHYYPRVYQDFTPEYIAKHGSSKHHH